MKLKLVAASLAAVGLNACVAVPPGPVAEVQYYPVADARGRAIYLVPVPADTATSYYTVPGPADTGSIYYTVPGPAGNIAGPAWFR